LWLKACNHARWNGVADKVLDATNFVTLAVDSQCKSSAITAGTTCTTNAVYVVFGLHR
jgi:hypothetical protein